MPYFRVPLENNRFIIGSVAFDAQKLNQEKIEECLRTVNFEGDGHTHARALIDTGATHCSITEELARKLYVNPVGKQTVGTAGNPIECNQYIVMLGIPVTEVHEYRRVADKSSSSSKVVPGTYTHHFKLHLSRVSALPKQQTTRGFDVIIGMDLLGKMIFQYSGDSGYPRGALTIGF